MTAGQVILADIVKKNTRQAFHFVDPASIRRFCLDGIADKGFKKVHLK